MKIRDKMLKELQEHGLSEEQAAKVMESFESNSLGEPMKGRMDDNEKDYPPAILTATWMSVKLTALNWIDENSPRHWARPMFVD